MNIIAKIKSLQRRVEALEAAAGAGEARLIDDGNIAIVKDVVVAPAPFPLYADGKSLTGGPKLTETVAKKGRRRGT